MIEIKKKTLSLEKMKLKVKLWWAPCSLVEIDSQNNKPSQHGLYWRSYSLRFRLGNCTSATTSLLLKAWKETTASIVLTPAAYFASKTGNFCLSPFNWCLETAIICSLLMAATIGCSRRCISDALWREYIRWIIYSTGKWKLKKTFLLNKKSRRQNKTFLILGSAIMAK